MIFYKDDFKAYDAELWNAIDAEAERQQNNIELIASGERSIQSCCGRSRNLLTNKYAQKANPGKRYHGGTDVIDVVESLLLSAKELFGAKFANVQPHSGSQATLLFTSLIQPGDTVMGMICQRAVT